MRNLKFSMDLDNVIFDLHKFLSEVVKKHEKEADIEKLFSKWSFDSEKSSIKNLPLRIMNQMTINTFTSILDDSKYCLENLQLLNTIKKEQSSSTSNKPYLHVQMVPGFTNSKISIAPFNNNSTNTKDITWNSINLTRSFYRISEKTKRTPMEVIKEINPIFITNRFYVPALMASIALANILQKKVDLIVTKEGEKIDVIKEKDIHVHIEDSPVEISKCAEKGIKVIALKKDYNKHLLDKYKSVLWIDSLIELEEAIARL